MDNVEKKVFEALAQSSYKVTLGGKEFEFLPMSLSDRQEISVISDGIPVVEASDNEADIFKDAIAAGRHTRQIAEIISIGAHIRGWRVRKVKLFGKIELPVGVASEKARRRELFRYAYECASIDEVYEVVKMIFVNSHPAFFLSIITSLCPKNILTPTKETGQIPRGQSKPA